MTRCQTLLVSMMLAGATSALTLSGLCDPPVGTILSPTVPVPLQAKKLSVAKDFGRLPLSFERNQGQTDPRVRFLTHTGNNTLFLTPSEAVFAMPVQSARQPQKQKSQHPGRKERPTTAAKIARVALRMQMVGANPRATTLEQQPLPGRINYFKGNDPSKWHAGVPTFGRVGFHGVYPGVDLVYYGNQRHLEYDFLVAPHADPKQIQLHFDGAKGVRVNAAGDLIVRTQGRELTWQTPAVYQQDAKGKHAITARFQLKRLPQGQTDVRFALGRYDAALPLVIDPVLLYSTYLGGSTTFSGDSAVAIAVDTNGNAYLTGLTGSTDFPTTAGAFQTTNHSIEGSFGTYVTKINPAGTALVYSTYLGGSDRAGSTGIAIDSNGNAYVTGYTRATDFPTTPGAFQLTNNSTSGNFNSFVTKLNPVGTALVYSTYLGGSKEDDASGIAVDGNGNAYVTGYSTSTDFPTTAGAFQTVNNGSDNAFVTKLNSVGTALVYSTYIGGSNSDLAYGIAIDGSGNAYIAGVTSSTDYPTTSGVFQPVNNAASNRSDNAFVTKVNSTGTALIYSTYLGGSREDGASGIAIDSSGNAYVTGDASSTDFPTTSGAFQRTMNSQTANNIFVTKLNSTGTALVYSTYLGGSNNDQAYGITADSSGNAYVTGAAQSTDFPTTIGAFQRVLNCAPGATNAFVTKLNSTGSALLYSTCLGGNQGTGDAGFGIVIDSNGNAYVAGYTYSTDFPTTPGAFQTTNHTTNSSYNAFVTKLSPVPIFPDFNNDGNTDLLIQNSSSNVIASWFMNGATWISGAYFSQTPPSDYALVGTGDFSGDGATTLVFQSRTTNKIIYWYTGGTNNATITGGDYVNVTPQTGWKLVGVGDFNGDGKSDLVLQSQTTNQVAIWFMSGPNYQGGVLMPYTPPTGWNVVGVGDFNADGFPDIAFQNQTTGQIALWYMNGPTYAGGTVMTTVPVSGWKVVGVGDYNGAGSADLLLQNQTSNQAVVWYLKNGAYLGGAVLSLTPPSGWKIVGPR